MIVTQPAASIASPPLALPAFQAALASVKAGTGDCPIAVIGDSTSASAGATSYRHGLVWELARQIDAYSGLRSAVGLVTPAPNGYLDARYGSEGNVWGADGGAGFGEYVSSGAAYMLFIPAIASSDRLRLYYATVPGGGSFTIGASNGPTQVLSSNAAAGIASVEVAAGLVAPDNAVAITRPNGNDGPVRVLGVAPRDSTQRRVLVGQMATPGAQSSYFVGNAVVGGAATGALAMIDAAPPKLGIVSVGINDSDIPVPVNSFIANVQTIAQRIVAAGGNVALSTMVPSSGANRQAYQPQYVAAMQTLCSANGYLFIDPFDKVFGGAYDATRMDVAGGASATVHDNDLGQAQRAQCCFDALRPYFAYAL